MNDTTLLCKRSRENTKTKRVPYTRTGYYTLVSILTATKLSYVTDFCFRFTRIHVYQRPCMIQNNLDTIAHFLTISASVENLKSLFERIASGMRAEREIFLNMKTINKIMYYKLMQ